MLAKLTNFFNSIAEGNTQSQHDDVTLEVACAVLLCEVMKADGKLTLVEQDSLAVAIKTQFSLSDEEVQDIIEQAINHSEQATDFFKFTSKLNNYYSIEERIKIVSLLWKIAYADGELASIEEHIIRKIADLLHLRHNEYISTKPRRQ